MQCLPQHINPALARVSTHLHSGWPTAEPSSQPMAAAELQAVSTTCHGQGRPHSRWYSLHAHFGLPASPCSKHSRESEAASMLRAWFLQYNKICTASHSRIYLSCSSGLIRGPTPNTTGEGRGEPSDSNRAVRGETCLCRLGSGLSGVSGVSGVFGVAEADISA